MHVLCLFVQVFENKISPYHQHQNGHRPIRLRLILYSRQFVDGCCCTVAMIPPNERMKMYEKFESKIAAAAATKHVIAEKWPSPNDTLLL